MEAKENDADLNLDQDDERHEVNVVSWIETTSRLYRVRCERTVFVIPGFGSHPTATALHHVRHDALMKRMMKRKRAEEKKGAEAQRAQAKRDRKGKGKEMERERGGNVTVLTLILPR